MTDKPFHHTPARSKTIAAARSQSELAVKSLEGGPLTTSEVAGRIKTVTTTARERLLVAEAWGLVASRLEMRPHPRPKWGRFNPRNSRQRVWWLTEKGREALTQ